MLRRRLIAISRARRSVDDTCAAPDSALGGADHARRDADGDAGEMAMHGHDHQQLDEREAVCRSHAGDEAGTACGVASMPARLSKPRSRTAGAAKIVVARRVVPRVRSCHKRTPTETVATITNRVGDDPTRCVQPGVQARADARRPARHGRWLIVESAGWCAAPIRAAVLGEEACGTGARATDHRRMRGGPWSARTRPATPGRRRGQRPSPRAL